MIVLTRTRDSSTPSAAGYLCHAHHNVKRVPRKSPMSRLHEKISHYVLVKLPGSEKKNCLITECSTCQEGNLKIRACQHFAAQIVRYHYILVIFVLVITPLYSMRKMLEVLLLLINLYLKTQVFCNVIPCQSVMCYQCFRGAQSFHIQRVKWSKKSTSSLRRKHHTPLRLTSQQWIFINICAESLKSHNNV